MLDSCVLTNHVSLIWYFTYVRILICTLSLSHIDDILKFIM